MPDAREDYCKRPLSAIIFMTHECDDSRHFADRQQQSSLSWDRIHSDEEYVRTSHSYGHQRFTTALSYDVGGVQVNIGIGNGFYRQDHRNYGGAYENNYPAGYNGYYGGYQTYGQDYRGNYSDYSNYGSSRNLDRGYDNSYRNSYGQIVSPRVVYESTPTSISAEQFAYEQARNQQRYQTYGYENYDPRYNGGYSYPNYDNRYTIAVNPGDQYHARQSQYGNGDYYGNNDGYYASNDQDYGPYAPTNNRFDLRYRGNRYSPSDDFYGQYDQYNSSPDCDDRYIIDRPYGNDYYGRYQNDYGQYYGDSYGRNQYQNYRYPNGRYSDLYNNDYEVSGYSNDYYPGQASGDWMRMRATLQSMLGHSPREFNRYVSDDLGCATIVSAALRQAHGVNIRDTSVDGLENSLRQNGYMAVPMRYAQPGDCIIAHRYGNRHGHAAIYVGDGKVVNNSSAQGRVIVAPLSNFAARDYESVVAYRRA